MTDPITEERFRYASAALCDKMVLTVHRTAYSGLPKNIMDYLAASLLQRKRAPSP
jgi:hypothetical protein